MKNLVKLKSTVKNVNRALKEVNAFEWEGDYRLATKNALKEILEVRMNNAVDEYLGRGWYDHVEDEVVIDYRNGSYIRHLLTELGDVELEVPRTRKGYKSKVLKEYERRPEHITRLILACFVFGMSTRKVAETLVLILGEKISPQTVSNIAKILDTEVEAYHNRPLEGRYRFLYFDGIVLKHKGVIKVQKKIILCAFGIRDDGVHEMIDFKIADSESETNWVGFLSDLYRRGLEGEGTELIVTDGGVGLQSALDFVYSKIDRQRCWVHKTRNILDKVKKKDQDEIRKAVNKIWQSDSKMEAINGYWNFCNKYRDIYPETVKCLEKDIEDLLVYFKIKLDKKEKENLDLEQIKKKQINLWKLIRTTNLIERCFVEVRRRTRPMGTLQNKESLERIIFAVMHNLNCKWNKKLPLFWITKKFTQSS